MSIDFLLDCLPRAVIAHCLSPDSPILGPAINVLSDDNDEPTDEALFPLVINRVGKNGW